MLKCPSHMLKRPSCMLLPFNLQFLYLQLRLICRKYFRSQHQSNHAGTYWYDFNDWDFLIPDDFVTWLIWAVNDGIRAAKFITQEIFGKRWGNLLYYHQRNFSRVYSLFLDKITLFFQISNFVLLFSHSL